MARCIYRYDEAETRKQGRLVLKEDNELALNEAPSVLQDSMDPLEHPCDGKLYTSKSEFRRVTKAHGCEELGTERRKRSISWEPRTVLREKVEKIYYDRCYDRIPKNPEVPKPVLDLWNKIGK